MTLRDINELAVSLTNTMTTDCIAELLTEQGEDCTTQEAGVILHSLNQSRGLILNDDYCLYHQQTIRCPKCLNTSPDTLLSSALQILTGNNNVPFGCCQCGTQFVVG